MEAEATPGPTGPRRAGSDVVGWLTGRLPRRRLPAWLRWASRSATVVLVGYLFLYGPGVRVWRSPPGFEELRQGAITVFFQPGLEREAVAVAEAALQAERAVLALWGRAPADGFDFPVDVYLCRSPRRYWHLVMNRARASAAGNDLLIHTSYREEDRSPFLRHELAHLYVVHELGWLRSRLHTPAWLDEGLATSLQGGRWSDRDGLARTAARSGELASLTTTGSTLRWLGAVTGGGDRAAAQYGYARAFTEALVDRYGLQTVLDFLVQATVSGDQAGSFARCFGTTLEQAEARWLAAARAGGLLAADLEMVDRGLPTGLLLRLAVLTVIAAWAVLWTMRHVGRLVRAVALRSSKEPAA